jgi:hypothetical protein
MDADLLKPFQPVKASAIVRVAGQSSLSVRPRSYAG